MNDGNAPITDAAALTNWISARRAERNPRGGEPEISSTDEWGRPFYLLSKNSRLWAIASAGRNGVWEDGDGDDVIMLVTLQEGCVNRLKCRKE